MLILELVETGKKVILLSELPLAYYGDTIEDEEFDEVLAYYDQTPYRIRGRRYRELMKKGSGVSVFEVPPIDYGTWSRLFDTYGFTADDVVRQILYRISDKPRFFIRMMRLFEDQESRHVDVEALCREAEKRRAELGMEPIVRRQRQSDRDLEYISKFSRELYAAITDSPLYTRYKDNATHFIAQRYELAKTVCRNVARTMGMPTALKPGQARRWGDPFYAARTLEKMRAGFAEVFDKVLTLYAPEYPVSDALSGEESLEEAKREEFKSLVQLCYRTQRMIHFMRYYYQQEYGDVEVAEDDIFYNKHRYTEHAEYSGFYVLLEPFRKAFQDLTEDRPLEVPRRYSQYTEEKKDCVRVQNWASILSRRHGLSPCGLPEAHGTVKCPICGEDAEGYTQPVQVFHYSVEEINGIKVRVRDNHYLPKETTVQIYRHPDGKPATRKPKNTPPSAYNQPGLRYHYIIPEEER